MIFFVVDKHIGVVNICHNSGLHFRLRGLVLVDLIPEDETCKQKVADPYNVDICCLISHRIGRKTFYLIK